MSIDSFQSFSSLHCSVLISLLKLNNFNIVSPESVNLFKLNQPHQSDSDFQDNTISILSAHINMIKKISCKILNSYIDMMKGSDSNDQSY